MVYKSTIQKILDKYLDFVQRSGSDSDKKEGFWKEIASEDKNNLDEIGEAQKINTIFSVVEEMDESINAMGNIDELNKSIDAYESTTVPLKEGKKLKQIYLKAAAVLLPFVIILSSVLFVATRDNATEYQIVSTEKGSKTKLVLEDGTTVWLNAESELRYPSTFKNQDKRLVTLTGEAYFDVARNEKKPFEVYAAGYRFKVLGTAFNVKAYPGEDKIETTLEHGKVNVERLDKNEKGGTHQVVSLKPKQTIVIYKEESHERSINVTEVKENKKSKPVEEPQKVDSAMLIENEDLSTYLAWKDNMLVFRDANISDMINDLERWYGINVEIADEKIKNIKFTGTFTVETPEQAIKILCVAAKIDYEIEKDKVFLQLR